MSDKAQTSSNIRTAEMKNDRWVFKAMLAVLFWAVPWLVSASELTPLMRNQVEAVVKDYLIKNPEIVHAAEQAYAAREGAQLQDMMAKTIRENRANLEGSKASPMGGNSEGDVTVVEFFDYNCGYCKNVAKELEALIKADKNVRIVYKEFPILGPSSVQASKAALAAHLQGKYAVFHQTLFTLSSINDSSIKALSDKLGLDHALLLRDMEDPVVMRVINNDRALAQKLNISGTPAFVIGERLAPGAVDVNAFQHFVAEQRAKAKK